MTTGAADESMIRATLRRIGAINDSRVSLLATRTRDDPHLPVYRDTGSGVIFIDGEASPAAAPAALGATIAVPDTEDATDTARRLAAFGPLVAGSDLCDFGCGAGSFLKAVQPLARSATGIELRPDCVAALDADGIACHAALPAGAALYDVITLFHSLEHLVDPAASLRALWSRLRPGGRLVVEVPHARDLLIEPLRNPAFLAFTLWSQHRVLHTKDSLRLLLADAGFTQIAITGVQRYGLANHLQWLARGQPGGHRSPLAALETPALAAAYAEALERIDATDTLVATATR